VSEYEQLSFDGMPEFQELEAVLEPARYSDVSIETTSYRAVALECATSLYAARTKLPLDAEEILELADKFLEWLDQEDQG
jgi:hypothetical protein